LARYPWLTEFPALLTETVPVQRDGAWHLRTKDARLLPLAPRFNQGWQLLALSGGHPLTVFGEWSGRQLLPLTAWGDRRLEFRF
jgi:hypothetical protein